MRQIRAGVFETNSSSVHSLTMCDADDYKAWEEGKKVYDRGAEELVDITPEIQEELDLYEKEKRELYDRDYYTVDEYWDAHEGFEGFKYRHKTQSGEIIIAFGYYGFDG